MNDSNHDNPLLDFSHLPRFGDIRPEHVAPALDAVIGDAKRVRDEVIASGAQSWDHLVVPLEAASERVHRMWAPVSHLNAVSQCESLRAAYEHALPVLTAYTTALAQDVELYASYRALSEQASFGQLDSARKRVVENTLRDFVLAGASLDTTGKARLLEIQKALASLASQFQNNVLDATQAWHLLIGNEDELAGLPAHVIASAREAASKAGQSGWRFGLDGAMYLAFMSHADRRDLRARMYEAYVCRASDQGPNAGKWDNGPVIRQLLMLRAEMADLLGFKHYGEYSLATKMAGQIEEIERFLCDLAQRAEESARAEYEQLVALAAAEDGISDFDAWDVAYYAERLRQQRYQISRETLRPYFPVARVLAGLFEIARRLYGITVRELEGVEVWDADVRCYEIVDAHGAQCGRFYLDLYVRTNKRSGAWMDDCISRKRDGDQVQVPVAFLVCNFSRTDDGTPILLGHEEVITLFHEFGHGLHHLLTRVDHVSVSGINGVPWDAVEWPSQFMENWCWQRESLDLISGHVETNEPLPDALYEKMIAARHFQAAMQLLRQIEFALFDIRLHSHFDAQTQDVQKLYEAVRKEVAVVPAPEWNRFQNSFMHIFSGGYAAGYYSYKWAELLSADAFGRFEEEGIFNAVVGQDFLREVLSVGGVCDPMETFVAFRGRRPDIAALLRSAGLASEEGAQ